jgi:hypothetical protein
MKPRRGLLQVRGNWSEEAPRAIPPYRDYLLICYQDDGCLLQGFACTHMQAPCEVSGGAPPESSLHEIQGSSGTLCLSVPVTLAAETRRSHCTQFARFGREVQIKAPSKHRESPAKAQHNQRPGNHLPYASQATPSARFTQNTPLNAL